ncbi:translation initiation factor 2 subunit 2 [Nematocida sp. AWRm77]|nr:translation initiation factor 2 subunit 2 [Nematocida sp. AWRm77]
MEEKTTNKETAIEEKLSKIKINHEASSNEESEEESDFVPVGFDYDGFNSIAEGIHRLEKPKTELNAPNEFLSYDMLLARIEKHLKPSDKEAEGKLKIPISIRRDGSTKTSLNITEICNVISRDITHLKQYIEVELSVNCSVDGEGRLVIKGIFPEAQLQKVVRNYIKQYVSCGVCFSLHTVLEKEDKLMFKKCLACNASQSVSAIQQGYKALTTKRSVLRRKAAE